MHLFRGSIDLVPSRGGHLVQRSHRHQWRGCFCIHLEEQCHVFLFVFTGVGGMLRFPWHLVRGMDRRRCGKSSRVFRCCLVSIPLLSFQTVVILEDFTVTIPFRNTIFDPFGFIFLAIACITHKKENIPGFLGGWRPFRTIGGSLMIFGCVASVLWQCTCKKSYWYDPPTP